MTTTVIQKTVRGLLAVGILLLLAIVATGWIANGLSDSIKWTIHTHEVIETLKDALAALQDIETNDRGFVITGDRVFVQKMYKAEADMQRILDHFSELTADNPLQVKNGEIAHQIAKAKMDFANKTVLDQMHGKRMIATLEGNTLMENFKKQVELMTTEEERLLKRRTQYLYSSQTAVWWGIGIMAIAGLGLLWWVFNITRLGLQEEQRRAAELDKINEGLRVEIESRIRVERALKEATLRLQSSNTDLQQFAYVASHDLQEPLRAVAGFLTLINARLKGTLDEETSGWIVHAVEGSQRMRRLINDLLSYARVESRGKTLENVDMNDALEQAKRDLTVAITESDAELISDKLPHVLGDEGQLSQLFLNLIGNALKFKSSERPVIRVTCRRVDNDWEFAVVDNGLGFDQEHAQRIFVIFQRLQGREEAEGTGIGLALCKKIVERHGGRIWAQSEKGKGSTFNFTIPVIEGESK